MRTMKTMLIMKFPIKLQNKSDVTPLLCKTQKTVFSAECSHCKALSTLIPKEQIAQLIGKPVGVPNAASTG